MPKPIPLCDIDTAAFSFQEALERLLEATDSIDEEEKIAISEAVGRFLSRDVITGIDFPAFRNSAMDGYALRAEDALPGAILSVVGVSSAGHPFRGDLHHGEAVRVLTGASVPEEADVVIVQERTRLLENRVELTMLGPPPIGDNIRDQGEELKVGQLLLPKHEQVTAQNIGLLASAGLSHVEVFRKLKVAFASTGDELKAAGAHLERGEIFESNRTVLGALLHAIGVESFDLGIFPDDRDLIKDKIQAASQWADVIITSGGASVGDADFVVDVLRELGHITFWKVAIKPGKPFVLGQVGSAKFIGLPGNPVSMVVTFLQLVRPSLLKMSGFQRWKPFRLRAVSLDQIKKVPGRLEFQRGIYEIREGALEVTSLSAQGSHRLTSISRANCFIVLPETCSSIASGELVFIEPFETFGL